jgi:hypothetical protein
LLNNISGVLAPTASASLPITANLYRWYDASVPSSITSVAGLVSQWNDLSGNAGHLTQATSTYQPTTGTTTQNGKNVLACSVSKMINTVSITSNALTYFIVANKTAAGGANNVFSRTMSLWSVANPNDYDSTTTMASFYAASAFGGFNPSVAVYRNSLASIASSFTYNQANRTSFRLDGSNTKLWHNATTLTGTTSASALNSTRYTAFTASDQVVTGGDSFLNGWIAEIVMYNAALSDSDVDLVNAYLKTKWGTV